VILSGRDIKWYIEKGLLKIEPVEEEQFQQNGIDLILEDMIDALQNKPITYVYRKRFYLGATREILTLPDDLCAFVTLRSTWARKGILICPTMVDAGFIGNLTVEIFAAGYSGPAPLYSRFLHLVFAKMATPGDAYKGKYQGQKGVTLAK
jgi:dCTP deaminase